MIHRRKGRKLKRTASHRAATLSNLCSSLIMHKKIKTTLAKAKELRRFIEPLVTKSKNALIARDEKPERNIHLRRESNKFLQDKKAVKMLFDEIAPKISERNGGYTRVVKMGRRQGDAAEMALIEFVDFNLEQTKSSKTEETEKTSKNSTSDTSKAIKPKVKTKTRKSAPKKTSSKKKEEADK